jgi:hypothetical protein
MWFPIIYVEGHKCGCNHPYNDRIREPNKGCGYAMWLSLTVAIIGIVILYFFS